MLKLMGKKILTALCSKIYVVGTTQKIWALKTYAKTDG